MRASGSEEPRQFWGCRDDEYQGPIHAELLGLSLRNVNAGRVIKCKKNSKLPENLSSPLKLQPSNFRA